MKDPRVNAFYRPVQQSLVMVMGALGLVGLCAAVYFTRTIVLMLLIGLGLGIISRPLVQWMQSHGKVGQKLAVPVFVVGLLAAVAGIFDLVYTLISEQVIPLSKRMPEYLHSLEGRLAALSSRYHFIPPHLGTNTVGAHMGDALQTTLSALSSSASVAGDLVFILAVCVYFVASPKEYFDGFLSLFPAHKRPGVSEVMKKSATGIRQWFGSQLIAMVIVGSVLALALRLIGHPYWYLLGILTGLLEMVPFVGPIAALASGVLITAVAAPDQLLAVLIIYFVLLQLEGNLIIPLLMKNRIKLPPIQLLTIMLVFADWFGLPGLLIATPTLAVARIIYQNVYLPRMDRLEKPTYLETGTEPQSKSA